MKRTGLLIHCSKQELAEMRRRARGEHRQISSYALSVVMPVVAFEEGLRKQYQGLDDLFLQLARRPPAQPRTTMLLRCSVAEARRIRAAASRRRVTLSGYVLFALHRRWAVVAARRELVATASNRRASPKPTAEPSPQ